MFTFIRIIIIIYKSLVQNERLESNCTVCTIELSGPGPGPWPTNTVLFIPFGLTALNGRINSQIYKTFKTVHIEISDKHF